MSPALTINALVVRQQQEMIICLEYINASVHSHYPSTHENISALIMVKVLVKCLLETEMYMGHGGREKGSREIIICQQGNYLVVYASHVVNVAIKVPSS